MLAQQAAGSGTTALAIAVLVGLVYLAIVRFLDLNEKEPLWTTVTVFSIGAVVATYFHLVVDSTFLELELVGGVLARDVALFGAVAIGVAFLGALSRLRGWAEINGLMDGIVYGAAAGFGFATGATFVRELVFSGAADLLGTSAFDQLWTAALVGLAFGVFGAIMGAGFGAAADSRSQGSRVGYPIAGLLAAFVVHLAYQYLRTETPPSAVALRWLALLAPVVAIVAVIVVAIVREQRAIAEELADEAAAGVVTEEELRLLRSFVARRGHYLGRLTSGDLDGWVAARELHNRQVQLALTERRYRNAVGEHRDEIGQEVARLRASILALKSEHAASSSTTAPAEA